MLSCRELNFLLDTVLHRIIILLDTVLQRIKFFCWTLSCTELLFCWTLSGREYFARHCPVENIFNPRYMCRRVMVVIVCVCLSISTLPFPWCCYPLEHVQELSQRIRGRSLPQPSSPLVFWHPLHLFPPAGNKVVLFVEQFLCQIIMSVVLWGDKPLTAVSLKKHVQTAMPEWGEGVCVSVYMCTCICSCVHVGGGGGGGEGENGRGQKLTCWGWRTARQENSQWWPFSFADSAAAST